MAGDLDRRSLTESPRHPADRPFLPVFDHEVRELINREADRPLIRYDREPEQRADGERGPAPTSGPPASPPQPRTPRTSGDHVPEELGTLDEERRRREADGQ